MDVFIYPQNKQGVSKDYVDDANALKLNLTGGSLTGNLNSTNSIYSQKGFTSNAGGTGNYGFLLNDQLGQGYRFGISHTAAAADKIKYSALTGSSHSFYNFDINGANPIETLSISQSAVNVNTTLRVSKPNRIQFRNK